MREIYRESLSHKILQYLSVNGKTKRALIGKLWVNSTKSYVRQILRELEEKGYIRESPRKKKNEPRYMEITKEGEDLLEIIETQYELTRMEKEDVGAVRRESRRETALQTQVVLKNLGCLVNKTDKLPLSRLIGEQPTPTVITGKEKEQMREIVEVGAFYSMPEIREQAKAQFGGGPMNATRCLGVLIQNKQMYSVYNINGRLIYFNETLENRTNSEIIEVFKKSEISQEIIDFDRQREMNCLLFATNYNAIPRIYFGRKSGKLKESNINPKSRWNPMKDRVTFDSLNNVFKKVCFVSMSNSQDSLTIATRTTPEGNRRVISNWISKQEDMREVSDSSGAQAIIKSEGNLVFCWFDNDLLSLYRLSRSQVKVHVVILTKGPEQAIARILGERLLSIRDITGEELKIKRYDNMGNPIEE